MVLHNLKKSDVVSYCAIFFIIAVIIIMGFQVYFKRSLQVEMYITADKPSPAASTRHDSIEYKSASKIKTSSFSTHFVDIDLESKEANLSIQDIGCLKETAKGVESIAVSGLVF